MPAVLALSTAGTALGADPGITLVGTGSVPGEGSDKSGLTGAICQAGSPANCVPAAILGGFGSDIDATGLDDVYVAAPDRGPLDGLTDVPYADRVHYFHIATTVGAAFPNIDVTLLETRALRDADGTAFVGAAGDFAGRLDPEGIRVSATGTLFVSDQYGPDLLEFDRQGNLVRRIAIPADFAIANPWVSEANGPWSTTWRTPGPRWGP